MNRIKKRALTALIGVAVISLVITSVAASPKISGNTPLYAFRMEQASSEMSFLPKEKTTFVYTTERGYTLNYDTAEACNVWGSNYRVQDFPQMVLDTAHATCFSHTCLHTCWESTCQHSCHGTCRFTCWNTCIPTCYGTCVLTCQQSCWLICDLTHELTCWEFTCWYICSSP